MNANMNEWAEVTIHVRRGDEFLVAHRSPESGGYWHTIAGKIEDGEEPDAAAMRELREETGESGGNVGLGLAFLSLHHKV